MKPQTGTAPLLQDRQERQVCATQVRPPSVLEDIADGPGQASLRVVVSSHQLSIWSQLQNQSIPGQQQVVAAQRNQLEATRLDVSPSPTTGRVREVNDPSLGGNLEAVEEGKGDAIST
ncbi:hypothetical protein INR49_009389 [Caranx melampygus]|nr:hypothetical protein INR49_009389 [Caranx melampygus]